MHILLTPTNLAPQDISCLSSMRTDQNVSLFLFISSLRLKIQETSAEFKLSPGIIQVNIYINNFSMHVTCEICQN